MESIQTTQKQRSEEWREVIEERLCESVERVKSVLDSIKEPYRQTVLDRVTESFRPEIESDGQCHDSQIKERLYQRYTLLDRRTKLLICARSEIRSIDGLCIESKLPRENRLIDRLDNELEQACQGPFEDPDDTWLQGVWSAILMLQQNI